jgi:hypothetical protein
MRAFWAKIAQNEIIKAALAATRFGRKMPKTPFRLNVRAYAISLAKILTVSTLRENLCQRQPLCF